jgi:hypothetical protein
MMQRIVNNLWLGSQHDADELVRHNPEKITAILNVRGAEIRLRNILARRTSGFRRPI